MPLVCRAAPGEVDADAIALDCDGHLHLERLGRESVVVDEVLGLVDAVGNGADGFPGEPLGVVLELRRGLGHRLDTEALEHLDEAPLPGAVGGELGVDVSHHQVGSADVRAQELLQDPGAEVLLGVEAGRRDPKPLRVDVGRVRVRAGRTSADVDVMPEGRSCTRPLLRDGRWA